VKQETVQAYARYLSVVDVEVPQTGREQVEFVVGLGEPVAICTGRGVVAFHFADAMLGHCTQPNEQGVPLLL
jgi:hypothetical protein